MKMQSGINPEGRCMYCRGPVRYKDNYCARCGKPNDCWREASETECGNCHSHIKEGDKYCRICGTRVGEGAYMPYQVDYMQTIYGPKPVTRKHVCRKCGNNWITCLMVDDEMYCPQCGEITDEVPLTPEEEKQYWEGTCKNLIS